MSDYEDLLGDDLALGDETYNLGNEEEDILLAGGNIDEHVNLKHDATQIKSNISNSEVKTVGSIQDVPIQPSVTKRANSDSDQVVKEPQNCDVVDSNVQANKVAVDQRYRDSHQERFPTERSNIHGVNQPAIPDSLDAVVPTDGQNKNFNNRRNNRGRRGKRGDLRNHENAAFQPSNYEQQHQNDNRRGRGFNDFRPVRGFKRGPDFNVSNQGFVKTVPNSYYRPDFPDDMRSIGPNRKIGMIPNDMGNARPSNMRISVDYPNPDNFRQFGLDNFDNRLNRNFDQRDNYGPPIPREPFVSDRGFPEPMNNFEINERRFTKPYENERVNLLPGHFNNRPPPGFPPIRGNDRDYGAPPIDHLQAGPMPINDLIFKNLPPMSEGKKVLINPLFIGNVQSHGLGNLGAARDSVGNPYNLQGSNAQNKLHMELETRKVSEEELERLAEQFIDEQRRCLQRAKAAAENEEFYEKTQRFIESATAEMRSDDRDSKKEYLKRKQEEFINENRLNLNRRRRVSPPRAAHRPSPPRHRISPYKSRPRPRSPDSPTKRELSGEPEEREYRVKLREQAEMRARILQAKERRRRRNAASLTEKINQNVEVNIIPAPPPPIISTKRSNNENVTTQKPAVVNVVVEVEKKEIKAEPSSQKSEDIIAPINNKQTEKMEKPSQVEKKIETLEDMLDDDFLQLSPEEEDLLLTDEEDLSLDAKPSTNNRIKILGKTDKLENKSKDAPKPIKAPITFSSTIVKRTSGDSTDLRKKLTKTSEAPSVPSSQSNASSPVKKRIVYSSNEKESLKKSNNDGKDDKKKNAETSSNLWKSTFSEQKLDLTAAGAARAISAVMRNTNTERSNARKVSKPVTVAKKVVQEEEKQSTNKTSLNGNGKQVVVATSGRRVVIPSKLQKPLVVIDNEDEGVQEVPKSKGNKKTTAHIVGLPPGMTEVRLLSLCGPEVERVNVGAGGTADVNFTSAAACQRFVRRFHGRMVAASQLSVTTLN